MGCCDLVFRKFHLTKEWRWWHRPAKVKSLACIPNDDTGGKKCLLMVLHCYPLPNQAELFFLLSNKINFWCFKTPSPSVALRTPQPDCRSIPVSPACAKEMSKFHCVLCWKSREPGFLLLLKHAKEMTCSGLLQSWAKTLALCQSGSSHVLKISVGFCWVFFVCLFGFF